ncbi:hypothetical protein GALMADRAFT_1079828 [Galerina marginata CBS 339.88]|uniref:polynucleotide adenylyltransferase n=1 Tax=Galerina marginata (strain CBS 339.88) TaxID=685588 RepID=A0A067SLB3_GALM3|nr:hypothetical protein GALMADRAFT_1079828 [Galerina marginata CBS 339.88]
MSPEPSRSHSRDKAESNGGGRLSRKARREQRVAAKRSGGNDTPVANGSSTPRKQVLETGKDPRPKSPNGTTSKNAPNDKFATFEEGEDFVAFTISDSDDEAGPSNRDQKEKHKESKVDVEQDDEVQLVVTDTRIGDTRVDKVKSERAKEKSKMQDPPSALRTSEREWDRSKVEETDRGRNGRHKRKHGDDYDRDDGYANKKQRMDAASRKCPWVRGLDLQRCQNVAEMLHKEVEAFVHWISPSPVEDEIRGLIVTQITKVVTASFPDAVVSPFGSYQTKLYLPLGDIDLVVLSDAMAYSDKSTVLHLLANTLKRAGITSHVTIIAKAKVPIVKFVTTHGRFKVDISINQGNGLVSGQIISGFLKNLVPTVNGNESKALRSLVMITKSFLSQRSMNEVYTGGLGSYSIVCLAVSFLQMHPKIRRGEIDPEKNLGVLMMEFFELYGQHFNYDEVGISLRDGGTYFSKRQRGWHTDYKRNMLSIEDPADPSNDISSGSYNFHKVRTAFAGCHGILTSTAYLRAGILSSRHHGRSVNLRGHYESEDLSILSTVMGITQEVSCPCFDFT